MTDSTERALSEIARSFAYDNHSPGNPGYCAPESATWSVETLDATLFVDVFADAAAARVWLESEIQMAAEEGLCRDWSRLMIEPVREEVVCLVDGDRAYIWDGFHRVASLIATGRPIRPSSVGHDA